MLSFQLIEFDIGYYTYYACNFLQPVIIINWPVCILVQDSSAGPKPPAKKAKTTSVSKSIFSYF